MNITQNLFVALRRLRHLEKSRTLWIDALCINQEDTKEKEVQVAMMGQIYSRASCGLLWLGEEPEQPVPSVKDEVADQINSLWAQSEAFLNKISPILQGYPNELPPELKTALQEPSKELTFDECMIERTREIDWRELPTETWESLVRDPDTSNDAIFHAFSLLHMLELHRHLDEIPYLMSESDEQHPYATIGRHGLGWILQRPWFERIWTVQECIMPKSCVIMYGPVKAPWTMFLRATENFKFHRTSCCAAVPGVSYRLQILTDSLGHVSEFTQARLLESDVPLDALLRSFRGRDASDLRDKVYGLLPLVTEWYDQDPIIPDYNPLTSPALAYTATVFKMIQMSGTFNILSQPGSYMQKVSPDVPTWVPDYSQRINRTGSEIFGQNYALYEACGDTMASVQLIKERILVLEGRKVGSVREAATRQLYRRDTEWKRVLLEWFHFAKALCKNDKAGIWKDHFWRTLCGDCLAEQPIKSFGAAHGITAAFRRASEDDRQLFNLWCSANDLSEISVHDTSDDTKGPQDHSTELIGLVDDAIRTSTHGRRFFISQEGNMGLAPSHAFVISRPDEIFVVPGGGSPLILRPAGEQFISGRNVPTYEFIGECYLHGFMDGEGMGTFDEEKQLLCLV